MTDEYEAADIAYRNGYADGKAEALDVEVLARLHHEGGWAPGGCTQRTSKDDEPWTDIEWFMCPKSDVHRAFGEWMSRAILAGETE